MTDEKKNQLLDDILELEFEGEDTPGAEDFRSPIEEPNWDAISRGSPPKYASTNKPNLPDWLNNPAPNQPDTLPGMDEKRSVEPTWLPDDYGEESTDPAEPVPEVQNFRLGEVPTYRRETKFGTNLDAVVDRARQSFDNYREFVRQTVQLYTAEALQDKGAHFMRADSAANLIFDITPRAVQETQGGKGRRYDLDVVEARDWLRSKTQDESEGKSARNAIRALTGQIARELISKGYDVRKWDSLYDGLRNEYKFDRAASDMFLVMDQEVPRQRPTNR